jgi:hypothetical protein
MDWAHLPQNRNQCQPPLNTMSLQVPQKAENLLTNLATISFTVRILLQGTLSVCKDLHGIVA